MPAREKRRETTAGFFVLIGLLLLGVLIVEFGRFGDRFSNHYPLFVEFSDTSGIIKGSEVRLRGARVGRVATHPELVTDTLAGSIVRMELRIRDDIKIPHDSTVKIGTSGIMGDTFVQIVPPEKETGAYYKAGDTIMGVGAGGFDSIRSDAETIAREASKRLKDTEATLKKMDEALVELRGVGKNLNITIHKVNTHLLSEPNLEKVDQALSNLEASSKDIHAATKELQPTIQDAKRTLASIRKAADSADRLIAAAEKEIQHIEPALRDVPKAVRSITKAAEKAEATMTALQDEKTLAGTLAYDQETGSNAKDFMRNLKRYGILRYRDDDSPDENDPRKHFRGSRR
ncbi:MCE family protein [Verrucomicrobiaceae bacterium N1E253]|uniref:MCE family protein n=1 Tax=Oceaniferula marina TaxID=2748318 RepID=A0A851GGI8_9BACT|nr:MlaD family protein [Oceaniferula marina]NWK56319.1 MCE family protein [Oceaniferula marina]